MRAPAVRILPSGPRIRPAPKFSNFGNFSSLLTSQNNVKCKHSSQSQTKQQIKPFSIFCERVSLTFRGHYTTLFQTVRFFLTSIFVTTNIFDQNPTLLNVIFPNTVAHVNQPCKFCKQFAVCARNGKRTRAPDLNLGALIEIQHKSYFQSNTVEKKTHVLFAGHGQSVLGRDLRHSFSQYGAPGRQITYISETLWFLRNSQYLPQ